VLAALPKVRAPLLRGLAIAVPGCPGVIAVRGAYACCLGGGGGSVWPFAGRGCRNMGL